MKKTGIFLILAVLALGLVLALAGCGSKEAPSPEGSNAASSSVEEPASTTMTPTEPETAAVTNEPEPPVAQPEVRTPQEPTTEIDPGATLSVSLQALRSLSSYRYTTTMVYEGTGDSQPDSGTITVVGEYSAPDRHHLTIIDSSKGEQTEFIKIGDSLWIYTDGEWTEIPDEAVDAMSQSIFTFALDFVWGTLAEGLKTDSNYVGKETVNGIKSLHYASTGSAWEKEIEAGFGNAHGDIWIAEDGYPVRFLFTASGTDEEGNTGSVEWRTDVTEVNTQVVISPPVTD